MMPSTPMILVKFSKSTVVIGVQARREDLTASKKNSIVKLEKTNWIARLIFRVPKNMAKVKSPHMKK